MAVGALSRGPEAAPRAPKCSPRSLQQTPRSSNITPETSKQARGVSEGPLGRHRELKPEARGDIWTSKLSSGGPFGPQNGDLGGLPKNERQTMKLSTRAHDLYLDICVSNRSNIDEAKRV